MAGAGFKTFTTGDILTASDVNTYLMQQTVMVFDDASARSTALPTPSEGMFSYLKDTNLTYRYDGSAWLSDAGTTSPLTTKGDLWTYSTTDARLPVGTDGYTLVADSGETTGLKWAAPSSGGMTLIESGNLSGSSVVTGSIPNTYENLQLLIKNAQPATDGSVILIRLNGDTGTNYSGLGYSGSYNQSFGGSNVQVTEGIDNTAGNSITVLNFIDYANTTTWKFFMGFSAHKSHDTGTYDWNPTGGLYNSTSAISTITIYPNNGNWSAGTYEVWGIK